MLLEQQLREGRCTYPFSFLGHHEDEDEIIIRAFVPSAEKVKILGPDGQLIADAEHIQDGLYVGRCQREKFLFPYVVKAEHAGGTFEYIDPYQYRDEAFHAVHYIDHAPENLYKQAGAQISTTNEGTVGVRFSVFAPNASSVSVFGSFNHWQKYLHPMQKTELGYWVLFVPNVEVGAEYKFAIRDASGNTLPDKSDPLGFHHHQFPSHCSVVYDHEQYQWNDEKWQKRKAVDHYRSPMSIYEVQLGSWRRPEQPERKYFSYREMADDLVAYVVDMGFTHIEVMPVSEYPFDGSWGYQPVGLFAPTSRFGGPDGFKYFVDKCHQSNISVIIDWVPAHFPADGHGLARFDGSFVYEYEDPRRGWHPDWNSCIYDFGKDTVRQFLVANALYWFDKFHVDGIRVDAVASMLYLDYSRKDGEWVPNVDGGNHNYEAISLLQWMNSEVYAKYPNAVTIAEESTSFAGVSQPVSHGGLGFGFKWNMGWMHDTLTYIAKDPAYRRYHHSDLTFSMVYAYDENFVLPISHDEVVHGKGSMLQKMPGDDWQKFANLRAYFGFMFAHPGKKLQFMGSEIAQWQEWNHDAQVDWSLLSRASHKGVQDLYKHLNGAYQYYPALYECDHEPEGFTWLDLHNHEQSVLIFARFDKSRTQPVIVVCNFTPVPHEGFKIGAPISGNYELIINTDKACYGGSDYPINTVVETNSEAWQGLGYSFETNIPPLATIMFALKQH
ncbi:1,4-alpha-glucan branching protein GlgB [Agaribacter flavus]|uniref:1,4-alpha-glucan branching enzyme GlgB n=1 Tax=Agaribacter flavus TaxID=1902781 RepID=A0ABV7FL60_9ALTE